jgi:hypothetical protein
MDPASMAICLTPDGVLTLSMMRGGQGVHHHGLVIQVKLPEEVHVFDGLDGEDFFVALPSVTPHVTAVGKPISAPESAANCHQNQKSSHIISPKILLKRAKHRPLKTPQTVREMSMAFDRLCQ